MRRRAIRGLYTGTVVLAAAAGLLWTAPGGAVAEEGAERPARSGGTCVTCHLELEEPELREPALGFGQDVHDRDGLGCVACHGGDPTAEDADEAMDPARGFTGSPSVREIPILCGSCHGDEAFIKKFSPNLPTDQLAQYRTSIHGERVLGGDAKAATCISCHGVHGILRANDSRSPVYPTRVVETCARCHADAELMGSYGIPADQVEKYRRSVHYEALTRKHDLSAPTCNDCHGSHGATPPGVSSISNVCGACHLQNAELFRDSPHAPVFREQEMGACEACHGNHEILPPDDGWVGVEEGTVCGGCHEAGDPGGKVAVLLRNALEEAVEVSRRAREEVAGAERAGMLMEEAEIALQEAHDEVVKARLAVHAVSVDAVEAHTGVSRKAAARALELAEAARREITVRRRGLLVASAFIFLAIVLLILKIRQIERPGG